MNSEFNNLSERRGISFAGFAAATAARPSAAAGAADRDDKRDTPAE